MNARLRYGILAVLVLGVCAALALSVTTTVIYTPEKDTFLSSYHNNIEVLRHQSLNSTTDVLPLMQDLLDYSGPIVLDVRIDNIDQARRDLESFSKNRVAFRNLVVNLDMNQSEMQEYADSLALQDKMFQDLINSSASFDQLRTLEIRYRNENNKNQLISVQMEGEDLRNRIHDLYGRYEKETQKIVNTSRKQGLDTTVEEQSLVHFQEYVREIEAERTPVELPASQASLLTLVLKPESGRFGDTVACSGYLVAPSGLSTPDRSRKNVTVLVDNTPFFSSLTDSSGHYSLQIPIGRIRAGMHEVRAETASARSEVRTLTVLPVDSVTSLSVGGITSKGGVTLTGSVIANRPVPLAPVELVWDGDHVVATTTDSWGDFREVVRLPAGRHTVIARFAGDGYPIHPSESEVQEVEVSILQSALPPDYSWLLLPLAIFALVLVFSGGALVYLRRSGTGPFRSSPLPEPGGADTTGPGTEEERLPGLPTGQPSLPDGEKTVPSPESLFSRYLRICEGSGLSEAAYAVYHEFSGHVARDLHVVRPASLTPLELSRACRKRPYCGTFSRFVGVYERIRYGGFRTPAVKDAFETALEETESAMGREDH